MSAPKAVEIHRHVQTAACKKLMILPLKTVEEELSSLNPEGVSGSWDKETRKTSCLDLKRLFVRKRHYHHPENDRKKIACTPHR